MLKKPDYVFKAKVLKTDLPLIQRQNSILDYFEYYRRDISVLPFNPLLIRELAKQAQELTPEEFKEAEKINHASYYRTKRLKKRIESLLKDGKCIFLTLTFTDDVLASTTEKQRRKKVVSYLKAVSLAYVANIDYGAKNGREHYHAVVRSEHVDYSLYRLGSVNGQIVRLSGSSSASLSKYISKLTNHAIKETTKRNAIIYSR